MAFTWSSLGDFIRSSAYEEVQTNVDSVHDNLACTSDNITYDGTADSSVDSGDNGSADSGNNGTDENGNYSTYWNDNF